jgi:hypothetical protein
MNLKGFSMTDAPILDHALAWADAVSLGIDARQQIDTGRYVIGDLALLVSAHYGSDEIGRFADDIHMEAKRVQEYRTVCRYYPPLVRASLAGMDLPYSMLRAAMRYDDLDRSLDMLHTAALEHWRVMDLVNAIKQDLGEPVPDAPAFSGPVTLVYERGRWYIDGVEDVKPGEYQCRLERR